MPDYGLPFQSLQCIQSLSNSDAAIAMVLSGITCRQMARSRRGSASFLHIKNEAIFQERHQLETARGNGRAGGSWAHLPAWTHWSNDYIYAIHSENNQKTGRTDHPQLKTKRKSYIKKGRRDRDMIGKQTPSVVTHKQERYQRCRSPPWAAWRSRTTSGTPSPRGLNQKDKPA